MRTAMLVTAASTLAFLGVARLNAAEAEAGPKQEAFLVKVTDFDKESAYEVLSSDDLKKLEADIKTETRLHTQALAAADKEWRKDENLKSKMFPRGKINPRKLTIVSKFADSAQAEERKSLYEEQEKMKAAREEERAAELAKILKGKSPAKAKAPKAVPERDLVADQAIQLYKNALDQLKAQPEAPAAGGEKPAQDAKPADAKAPEAAKDAPANK